MRRHAAFAPPALLPPGRASVLLSACARQAPSARLSDTRTVVVGGGPAGLAAAALLSVRGWRDVTVLERAGAAAPGDPSRSFSYAIGQRGQRALDGVAGVLERIGEEGISASPAVFWTFPSVGEAVRREIRFGGEKAGGVVFLGRAGLLRLLSGVVERAGVTVLSGFECEGVRFRKGGCEVFGRVDGEEEVMLEAGLVLGCDGPRSVVREACRRDSGEVLESSRGFELEQWDSPSVGICYKNIALPPEPRFRSGDGGREVAVTPEVFCRVNGEAGGRPAREVFNMTMFPVGSDASERRIGSIACGADHALWDVRGVEEAYVLFARNFPQLEDVRAVFGREAMEAFVSRRENRFPMIQRSRSLVGCVGTGGEGAGVGVVVLGDAAHAFPPDLGQGVNSALEDVALLCKVLDEADAAGGGLCYALQAYETARDADVSALMRLMVVGGPYQYGQDKVGAALWIANTLLRSKLAQLAPAVFDPQIFTYINRDLPYSVMLHNVNETTRRLWWLAAALAAAPVAVVVALGQT